MRDLSKSQKDAVVQGNRLIHLLSSWSGYRVADQKASREPRVRVRLKVGHLLNCKLFGTGLWHCCKSSVFAGSFERFVNLH